MRAGSASSATPSWRSWMRRHSARPRAATPGGSKSWRRPSTRSTTSPTRRRRWARSSSEAVLVEASDDERAHLLLLVGEVGEAELPHQMIGEERPLDQHVLERGAPIVVVAAAAVPGRAVDVVAVVFGVLLPVDLADGGSRLDLGFLRLGRVLLGTVLSVDRRHLGRSLELLVDVLLQHGVLGELLVDQRLQLGT